MKLEINSNEYEIIIVEENDERLLIDDYIHTGKIDYIKQEIYIQVVMTFLLAIMQEL